MSRRKIIVNRVGDRLHILAPFGARELVKSIPARRWDAARKVWTVPADLEEEAREVLDGWPGGVSFPDDVHMADRLRCRVCRRPMVDLADGHRTHPGCDDGRPSHG